MTFLCLQLFIRPTNISKVTIMPFNLYFYREKQWVQNLWLRAGWFRCNVSLTSGQWRDRDPGAVQPPLLSDGDQKKETITLWSRTLLLLLFNTFIGSDSNILTSVSSCHSLPSAPPSHIVHLFLRILQRFSAFTAPSTSSQPPNLFLEICCVAHHLPHSFHSLPTTAFAHIFEHRPRKAICFQIMRVRIIVIL